MRSLPWAGGWEGLQLPSRGPQQVQFPGSPPFLLELLRLSDTCIIWPASIVELCLHNGDNLQPISGIRGVAPRCSNQPLAEVFCSDSWRTTRAVQAKPAIKFIIKGLSIVLKLNVQCDALKVILLVINSNFKVSGLLVYYVDHITISSNPCLYDILCLDYMTYDKFVLFY